MKTIVLHLAGPIQSWAGPALVKTRVDTDRKPSERALKGMLASTWGIPRESEAPEEISKVSIQIETLKSGKVIRDFQTISSRSGEENYLERIGKILNRGKRAPGVNVADNGGFNSIVRRSYLADSKFLILIKGANETDTLKIYEKLLNPVWSPYLGKKAFAPTFPFILGIFDSETALEEGKERLKEIEGE